MDVLSKLWKLAMGCEYGAFKAKVCDLGRVLTFEMRCFIFYIQR